MRHDLPSMISDAFLSSSHRLHSVHKDAPQGGHAWIEAFQLMQLVSFQRRKCLSLSFFSSRVFYLHFFLCFQKLQHVANLIWVFLFHLFWFGVPPSFWLCCTPGLSRTYPALHPPPSTGPSTLGPRSDPFHRPFPAHLRAAVSSIPLCRGCQGVAKHGVLTTGLV